MCMGGGRQECGFGNVKDAMVKNVGNWGSIPVSERSLEKEMATHASILALKIHRGAWRAAVHGVATSQT